MIANYSKLTEHMRQKYGAEYTNKIAHLQTLITENDWTGKGKFCVFPLEAGVGKSLETDRIIGEHISQSGNRRFLLVKQFTDDVRASVERINSHQNDLLIPYAVGITAENWHEYRDNLSEISNYRVVVITHQRYLQLCVNEAVRSYFETYRHTLIIDEALSIGVSTFSDEVYRKMYRLLPTAMYPILGNVCYGLLSELARLGEKAHGNRLVECRPSISNHSDIDEFAALVEANINNIPFTSRGEVQNFVRSLTVLYSNRCLYNNRRISAVDPTFKLWRLQNNIVLDATGVVDRRYELDEGTVVDRQSPIIDHSSWVLHQVDFNSSISNISRTEDYPVQLVSEIMQRQRPGDKTLVVTRNKYESELQELFDKYGANDVTVTHFGNIVGKNDWRDYTQIWIAVMPNVPMETYVLWWSMATGNHFSRRHLNMVAIKGAKGRFTFKDEQIEKVRFGCVVAEMYQAIKRINRDNTQDAEVFVVTADDKLVTELRTQLRGIRLGDTIQLDVKSRKSEDTPPANFRAIRLANHLRGIRPGTYSKREIREAVEIDASNFGKCLKDANIVQLRNAGLIEISTRSIEIRSCSKAQNQRLA